jgi:hypothetical protein
MEKTAEKTVKNQTQALCDSTKKSVEEYIDLGLRVQDEMFKMAQYQMNSFQEYTQFAIKNQVEFFNQFERNSKATRELWVEGLKKWNSNVEAMTKSAQQ